MSGQGGPDAAYPHLEAHLQFIVSVRNIMPQESGLRWGHLEQARERGWPFELLLFLQPRQNGGPGQ